MPDLALDIVLAAHDSFSDIFKKLGVEVEGMRGKIGLLAGGFGVLAGGALAESVKQASDFQTTISQVAANTNMTNAQMDAMAATIKSLASESSAPLDDLARGYEHIGNFGYRGADATNILKAAMESAVSTGSSTADVANLLSQVMKEYGLATNRATDAINVMHTAAAMGNMRLNEFVEYGGRAIGMAAGLKVPLTEVSAAMAALTQHGEDAARAGTDVAGLINHIVSPAKHARDELAYLSHVTGVDLVHDFSAAGLQSRGLAGVLADLGKATHGNKGLLDQLVPAIHGGYAAFQLTNQGAADFQRILSALNDTMAGKSNPTAEAYARTQQTVAFQLGVLKNNLQLMAISIGEAVLPAINRLLGAILPVVRAVTDWTSKHSGLVAGLLAGVAVVGTLIGAILVLGPAIAAIASPIGLIVVAIGAAVAGLTALLSSSSGLRDTLVGIWSKIADDAGALWQWLTGIWNGISGDAMLLWENLGSWLSSTWTGIVSAAAPIWNGLVNAFTYVWDRITNNKQGAADALKAIPKEWRPLVQDIGTVLSGSWFTVKYIWDTLSGNHKAATADLQGIPNEWHPLVQAIGEVFAGSWFTVKYLWDTLSGNHAAATADLRAIPKEWRPLVQDIGNTLSGSFMTVKYLWDDITGDHKKATNDLKGIPKEWQPLVKDIAKAFDGAKKDMVGFWHEAGDVAKKTWEQTIKPTWKDMSKDWHKFLHDMAPLVGPAMDNIKKALAIAAAPFAISMGAITGALSGAWKGFWSGDGKGGAKQLLLDGLHTLAKVIRDSAHIIYDVILVVFSLVGLNWGKAKAHLKDAVVAFLDLLRDTLTGSDKAIVDAFHAIVGAFEGYFTGMIKGAVEWGRAIVRNMGKGVQEVAHELYTAVRNALGPIGKLFPKSPAEEGPLSIPPDFRYIGDAMRHAIPHVRAAASDLMGAAGLGGGSLGLNVGASGGFGGAAGAASTFNAGHSVTIAPNITIQGGTFTDKKGISDLAAKVSEEIMHKVRMQGGLLPQI